MVSAILGCVVLATINEILGQEKINLTLNKFLACFSAKRNLINLIKDTSNRSIMFSAMKLGPLAFGVCSHAFTALNEFAVLDPFDLENSLHKGSAIMIRGWQLLVPLLFLISGYFTSFSWIGKLLNGNGQLPGLVEARSGFIKRLIRFIPSMAFPIFYFSTKFHRIYSDPRWLEVMGNVRCECRTNWWTNLLFVNNVINMRNGCINQAWSTPVQMQLFLFGVALLLILNHYPRQLFKILGTALVLTNLFSLLLDYSNNVHGLLIGIE